MLHLLSRIPNSGYRLSHNENDPNLSPHASACCLCPCSSSHEEGCVWLQSRAQRVSLGPQSGGDTQTSQPPPQHVFQVAPLGRECAPRAHPRAFMPFNSLGVAAKESAPQTQGRGT